MVSTTQEQCFQGIATSSHPSIVGHPKTKLLLGTGKDCYIGDEAIVNRGMLWLESPIVDGIIEKWDDMEQLWQHTFSTELRVSPEDHPVILTEVPHNPTSNREKMTQIMFETFHTPSFYVGNQQVFSLYASGETMGLVLDIGENMIHSVPIYEGHVIDHATIKLPFGGRDLIDFLTVMINERGYSYSLPSDLEIIRDLKEKLCYVALDYDEESFKAEKSGIFDVKYEISEFVSIVTGQERFKCPESLFQPKMIGKYCLSIQDAISTSICRCDNDIHQSMFDTVVLAGGTGLFAGIDERLTRELVNLAPTRMNVHVIAPTDGIYVRNVSAWIGGSILASLSSFQQGMITKKEYEEVGPRIVHQKCF